MSVNKVILIGHLGKDPELKYTPNGRAVATFSLATNKVWNDQSGQKQEKTTWHNIVAWGKQAEVINEYCRKGKQLYIEGRIENRSWDKDDGTKGYISEVVVENFQFLGGRNDAQVSGGSTGQPQPSAGNPPGPSDAGDDDDLPF
ncbi:MAG: single-stranded DNA-binding protein [bacterium]